MGSLTGTQEQTYHFVERSNVRMEGAGKAAPAAGGGEIAAGDGVDRGGGDSQARLDRGPGREK